LIVTVAEAAVPGSITAVTRAMQWTSSFQNIRIGAVSTLPTVAPDSSLGTKGLGAITMLRVLGPSTVMAETCAPRRWVEATELPGRPSKAAVKGMARGAGPAWATIVGAPDGAFTRVVMPPGTPRLS